MKIKSYIYLISWRLFGKIIFRFSPYFLFKFRVLILRIYGANVSWSAKIFPSSDIYSPKNLSVGVNSCISYNTIIYNVAKIKIGSNSCISQYSFLCTASHDYNHPNMKLETLKIDIGNNVWVGSDVFVGMGCIISDKAVIAARSTIFKNVNKSEVVSSTNNHFLINKRK